MKPQPQSTFGIAKALHYIIFGSEYLKDIIRQEKLTGTPKNTLNNYINRLDWIVNDVFGKMRPESAQLLRTEMKERDIAAIDSVLNMLIALPEDKRLEVEQYISDNYLTT